jgi:hypothetical protein
VTAVTGIPVTQLLASCVGQHSRAMHYSLLATLLRCSWHKTTTGNKKTDVWHNNHRGDTTGKLTPSVQRAHAALPGPALLPPSPRRTETALQPSCNCCSKYTVQEVASTAICTHECSMTLLIACTRAAAAAAAAAAAPAAVVSASPALRRTAGVCCSCCVTYPKNWLP